MLKLDAFRKEARTITEGQFVARYGYPVLVVEGLVQGDLLKQPSSNDMERHDTIGIKPGRTTIYTPRTRPRHPGTMMLVDPVHGGVFGPETDATFHPPSPLSNPVFVWIQHKKGRPTTSPISIGRVAQCDVVVADFTVSRDHAEFARNPDAPGWMLIDRGSRNGTKVDDEWLTAQEPKVLANGAHVGLGRVSFVYYTPTGFYGRLRIAAGE
ncbi:MAG: FHA domain-containing protein [Myxococcota bacterium]|nr:FHA domain-containing protein [Myxococcota bacterium]